MARPPKNNCDYFPHDASMRNHRKVKAIRNKFTNGYAIWNMLLEYICDADGNEFENSVLEYELMSGDFGFTSDEISEVIKYCLQLEMLFERNGFIYSESLNEKLAPVYEKRGKAKELSKTQQRKNGRFVVTETTEPTVITVTETTELTELPITEIPQIEVNRIKVKKIKVIPPEVKILRANCKQLFLDFYLNKKGDNYLWDVIDGTNLPKLIAKIKNKILEKSGTENCADSEIEKGFDLILKNINDEWVIDNLSLAIVNSKFNTIFSKIKNNAGTTKDNTGKPISKYYNT